LDFAYLDVARVLSGARRITENDDAIRRCWSTWNVLCTFLYTGEQLARSLPEALPRTVVEAFLETVARARTSKRQSDGAESDLALIPTSLLAGLRAEDLQQANAGDIRTTQDGAAVINVKGQGDKDRHAVPIYALKDDELDALLVRPRGSRSTKQVVRA
jgi:integrase